MEKFYITTPIYYCNGSPHIGHCYTSVAADVMARFKRMLGYDVFFLTGTDEHGQKVESAANAQGIFPKTFVDKIAQEFINMGEVLDISNDDFIRTTEARHKAACGAFWTRLVQAGAIYLGSYDGWYAAKDECFYDESETIKIQETKNSKRDRCRSQMGIRTFLFLQADRLPRGFDFIH